MKGIILNQVSVLEPMIDWFLTNHFCSTKREQRDFLVFIMPSKVITLENKRIIFKKIIELYYPSFKKKTPSFHASLGKIIEFRNQMAHYSLDISPQGVDKFMATNNMILLDNTRKIVEITQKEILNMMEQTKILIDAISELTNNRAASPPLSKS